MVGKIVFPRAVVEVDVKLIVKVKAKYEKTIQDKTYSDSDIKDLIKQLSH